jgi:hypothetical protein
LKKQWVKTTTGIAIMHNAQDVCPDLAVFLEEWKSADQPLLDPRPEVIECYLERKADARSALRDHLLTCADCALTKSESKIAEILARLSDLVRPVKVGGTPRHNIGTNGHRHGSRA